MSIDERLRRAMTDEVRGIPETPDRWAEIEARAATARRRQARRRAHQKTGAITALALTAAAAAALIAMPALMRPPSRRVVVTPGGHTTTVPARPAVTKPVVTGPPSESPVASGYQPLYPFGSLEEATAWESSYRAGGVQPWHLDAGTTGLNFLRFLGYTNVTPILLRTDSTGAHLTVGFPNPTGGIVTSAVLHLRRFGTDTSAPWEVVGTDDDASFSLTKPAYGAVVTSPLAVGGAIVGVDESIRVEVLQLSTPAPLGVFCCQPAGSSGVPWMAHVAYHGATDKVLIVAASTGGHLATVERFTVTGVRTSAGTTPGL